MGDFGEELRFVVFVVFVFPHKDNSTSSIFMDFPWLAVLTQLKAKHMTSINIMFLIMSYHVKYGLMVRKENFKTVQNHQPHFRYVASVRCQIPYWNILKPGSQNGKHGHGKSQIHGSCSRIFPFALIFNSTVCWKMTIWKKNTRILNELNGPWIFHMARNYRR